MENAACLLSNSKINDNIQQNTIYNKIANSILHSIQMHWLIKSLTFTDGQALHKIK